jgi:hypothetical protein
VIDSPWLKELEERVKQEARLEGRREALLEVLEARFGPVPAEVVNLIQATKNEPRLREFAQHAATSSSFRAFRKHLTS